MEGSDWRKESGERADLYIDCVGVVGGGGEGVWLGEVGGVSGWRHIMSD